MIELIFEFFNNIFSDTATFWTFLEFSKAPKLTTIFKMTASHFLIFSVKLLSPRAYFWQSWSIKNRLLWQRTRENAIFSSRITNLVISRIRLGKMLTSIRNFHQFSPQLYEICANFCSSFQVSRILPPTENLLRNCESFW